jgi:hypothetical protein
MVANPDWLWVPSYYSWTPYGYVYIDGYWDYALARRGYFFAPVYYGPGWVWAPGYRYRPLVVIGGDVLVDHFFCFPRYRHYYFGDYYAADYSHRGIYPWFAFHMSRYGYDPIYAHQRWYYQRTDPMWESRVRQNYSYRQSHVEARPPPTYRQQQVLVQKHDPRVEHFTARPVHEMPKMQPMRAVTRTPPRIPPAPRPDPTMKPEQHRPDALQHPNERFESHRNTQAEPRHESQRIEERRPEAIHPERRQSERFEERQRTPERERVQERRQTPPSIERREEVPPAEHRAPPAEHHPSAPPEHHVAPAPSAPPPSSPPPSSPPPPSNKPNQGKKKR